MPVACAFFSFADALRRWGHFGSALARTAFSTRSVQLVSEVLDCT